MSALVAITAIGQANVVRASAAAEPPSTTLGVYRIHNKAPNNKCLDADPGSMNNTGGSKVHMWTCVSGNSNQEWYLTRFVQNGRNYDRLINVTARNHYFASYLECHPSGDPNKWDTAQLWRRAQDDNRQHWYMDADGRIACYGAPTPGNAYLYPIGGANEGTPLSMVFKLINIEQQWWLEKVR